MIVNETFAGSSHHFEVAKRAQVENPFTTQNQVVELQKATIQSQQKAQVVHEAKNSTNSAGLKPKQEKEELVSYSRKGLERVNISMSRGQVLDSLV